jgi:hypothetical protein
LRYRLTLFTFIVLLLSQFIHPAKAEPLRIVCPNGGSYQILLPAGAAVNGDDCGGDLVIDPRVKIITGGAFKSGLITSLTVPSSVAIIEGSINGDRLEWVSLSEGLQSIGIYGLWLSDVRAIVLPESLVTIGAYFLSGSKLEKIHLGNSIEVLDSRLFADTKVNELFVPDSVKSIQCDAFDDMQLLETIYLPSEFVIKDSNDCDISLFNEENYSLKTIYYCGKISTFPIKPVCPGNNDEFFREAAERLKSEAESLQTRIINRKVFVCVLEAGTTEKSCSSFPDVFLEYCDVVKNKPQSLQVYRDGKWINLSSKIAKFTFNKSARCSKKNPYLIQIRGTMSSAEAYWRVSFLKSSPSPRSPKYLTLKVEKEKI